MSSRCTTSIFAYLLVAFCFTMMLASQTAALVPIRNPAPSFVRSQQLFASTSIDTETAATTTTIAAEIKDKVILYDGVCNFCNAWVDILLRIDVNKRFKFAPLQSEIGRTLLAKVGREADDISSVILVQPDLQYFSKSECVLKVVEELGPLAGVFSKGAAALVPEEIRDSIYDTVAENRYNLMGKRDECRCSDPQFAERFIS